MSESELRSKCIELTPAGCAVSAAVLGLLADRDAIRALALRLAERCHVQSGLLTRMVEAKYACAPPARG